MTRPPLDRLGPAHEVTALHRRRARILTVISFAIVIGAFAWAVWR